MTAQAKLSENNPGMVVLICNSVVMEGSLSEASLFKKKKKVWGLI
jgi:hypothetical protein